MWRYILKTHLCVCVHACGGGIWSFTSHFYLHLMCTVLSIQTSLQQLQRGCITEVSTLTIYQMVRSGCGKASPALYTCLFNACANSPIRHIGLEKATQLRQHMLMTGEQPNYVTYQAMIKGNG